MNWFAEESGCGTLVWIELPTAGSISSGGYHGIHCWWDLIMSKQLSGVSLCRAWVFTGFSGHDTLIHNIIPPLKKGKCGTLGFNFIILLCTSYRSYSLLREINNDS